MVREKTTAMQTSASWRLNNKKRAYDVLEAEQKRRLKPCIALHRTRRLFDRKVGSRADANSGRTTDSVECDEQVNRLQCQPNGEVQTPKRSAGHRKVANQTKSRAWRRRVVANG